MRHPIKPSVIIIGALLGASFTAAAWLDVAYVLPAVAKARAVLAQASNSERQPSLQLLRLLAASDGENKGVSVVVRRLLPMTPSQVEGLRTPQRQLVELGATLLIGWHLDEHELTSTRLASAYLGTSHLGFEQAAVTYFREPLSTLSREQLAELVALERAPTATPETVKRIKQLLLDRTAQVGAPAP